MPVHKRGVKPFVRRLSPQEEVPTNALLAVAIERSPTGSTIVPVEGSNSMACEETPSPTTNRGSKQGLIHVYQRLNSTWVDIDNRYPPLPFEGNRVLGLIPGATRAVLVTGVNVPVGYRRYEVTR